MTPSSMPIEMVPSASNAGLSVSDGQPDAEQREHQPDQRAEVLQQHHRQLRHLGLADELPPGPEPFSGRDSTMAVRNE